MQINRISNTQFKGAYFITGCGKEVKEAEEKIESKLKDNYDITKLGYGYTTNEAPAYILVTTGDDVARYNKFAAARQRDCYNALLEENPEKSAENFDDKHDYLK